MERVVIAGIVAEQQRKGNQGYKRFTRTSKILRLSSQAAFVLDNLTDIAPLVCPAILS